MDCSARGWLLREPDTFGPCLGGFLHPPWWFWGDITGHRQKRCISGGCSSSPGSVGIPSATNKINPQGNKTPLNPLSSSAGRFWLGFQNKCSPGFWFWVSVVKITGENLQGYLEWPNFSRIYILLSVQLAWMVLVSPAAFSDTLDQKCPPSGKNEVP